MPRVYISYVTNQVGNMSLTRSPTCVYNNFDEIINFPSNQAKRMYKLSSQEPNLLLLHTLVCIPHVTN